MDFKTNSKNKELLIDKKSKIVIVAHRNPDGDAMGAALALYNAFVQIGHEVNVVLPNMFAGFLRWMPGAADCLIYEYIPKKCDEIFQQCDVLFAVDFNDLSRVREFEKELGPLNCHKILIDHHPDPGHFADFMLSDTSVSSTCELVYLFLKSLDNSRLFTKDIAECIYTGIMTDTGCFSFNSSKRQTFEVVADLLDLGIDKDKIYDKVFDNYSYDRMRLLGNTLLNKMVVLEEYQAAFISLTQEEMKQFSFKVGDSEGFVNIPLSIKGVIFSALFTEKDNIVKVSLRSKGDFPVNEIARKFFNGGGHKNASGGESPKSLNETIELFKNLLPEYKSYLNND